MQERQSASTFSIVKGFIMRLSDNSDYREYMRAYAHEKYEAARIALNKCLNNPQAEICDKAFFLQCLGDIYFLEQNKYQSIRCYQLAETVDPGSLFPRYVFAKFLAYKLGQYDEAIKKCDAILLSATTSPFDKTDEDFGSDYYIAKANELKIFCEEKLRQKLEAKPA
jgi:tetratricopeptide (TPR) repeat protein